MPTKTVHALSLDLAGRAPEAMVPCPVCAGAVKAKNLASHLDKKHGATRAAASSASWRGVDRRMNRLVIWLPLVYAAAVLVTVRLDLTVVPALVVVTLGMALTGLVGLRVFRARISFGEHAISVRRWGGLVRRTVPFPVELTVGGLRELRRAGGRPEGSGATESHHAGTYLRLTHGRRSLTVGCPTGTGVRGHWAGWSPAPATRWWDVTLAAPEFVGLQYALAERGLLELRATERRHPSSVGAA